MQMTIEELQNENSKKRNFYQSDLHLTDRDFLIFRFLLDMKFASREAIAEKFFWSKDQKSESCSLFRTRDRLYKLQKHKWILAIQFPGSTKNYFVTSRKAYRHLLRKYPTDTFPKPSLKPDYRCFQHDLMVLKSRLHLESKSEIQGWISDKFLRFTFGDLNYQKSDFNVPDAIYKNKLGKNIAFELERIQKSKTKYREKLKNLIRSSRMRSNRMLDFEKIHFVCLTNAGFNFLKEETKIYGDLFLIEKAADFFNSASSSSSHG